MELQERPREKALHFGLKTLSDQELLMLLIGSGYKGHSVDEIAMDVLKKTDYLASLMEISVQELMEVKGIHQSKALQILGGAELARRSLRNQAYRKSIDQPSDLADWFNMEFGVLPQENVVCVFLDVRLRIIAHKVIFVGTASSSQIHPREIFKEAILHNSVSILLIHNHPSNDVSPSREDIDITEQIRQAGQIMGIELLDHMIVTRDDWYSFRSHGYFETDH